MSSKRKKVIINFELDESSPIVTPQQLKMILTGQKLAARGINFDKLHIEEATANMQLFKEKMEDALLVLRLDFGKLKAAIEQAVAPLAAVFLPLVDKAVRAVTRFAKAVGLVLGAVIGTDGLTGSLDDAAQGEKTLETNANAAAKAVKRSLAEFDRIDRLGTSGGGSSSAQSGAANSQTEADTEAPMVLSVQLDVIAGKIRMIIGQIKAMIAPLQKIDLTPMMQALSGLGGAFSGFSVATNQALGKIWFQVLVPIATWIMEKLVPVLTMVMATILRLLDAAVTPLSEGFLILWDSMKPIVSFIGDCLLVALMNLQYMMDILRQTLASHSTKIIGIFQNIGTMISAVWSVAEPVLTLLRTQFTGAFIQNGQIIGDMIGFVIDKLYGLTTFLSGVFTGDWKKAWSGLADYLKSIVNSQIATLNKLLSSVGAAMNGIIALANNLSFKIPDWVPSLGGQTFSLGLIPMTVPQIPYLAQGAVLPPNKPFMAMVGDQKHGTNIEAPLQTIKQALSEVMAAQGNGDIHIQFTGDLAQLARVLKPAIEREDRRVGVSMVRKAGV